MRSSVLLSLLAVLMAAVVYAAVPQAQQTQARPVSLTAEERRWLDAHGDDIILTYDASFPPIEFLDENGHYAGMGADIVARVEMLLGVSFKKLPTNDWKAFLADLESGKVHLNAGMANTKEREGYALCSAPYISLPLAIITTPKAFPGAVSWPELKGRRVAVVSGYMTESYVREHSHGEFTVVPVGSVLEGLRDVSFGMVDVFVDNLATSSYYIERDSLTNLRVAGTLDITFPMSICVSRKYPLLASAVQKALDAIPAEDIEVSRKRWISLSRGDLLSPETMRTLKFAAVFAALLLLSLAGISYFLKRRLNEKVRTLRSAQQELLEQTERLALATEATNAGVWDVYPATGQAFLSDQWFTMLGFSPGAVPSTFAGWMSLLHPEDRAAAEQAFAAYCESGGEGMYEAEFRLRQADGSWRWVLGKGRAIAWDRDGSPTRIIGLNLDIQKMKEVQENLRRSESLVKAAFDQTFQLCGLLDTKGRVVKLNKRALALSGASAQDMLGQFFWDCPWWPDHAEAERVLRQDLATALSGGVVRREVVHTGSDGKQSLVDFSLSPLMESGGSVNILIAEGRDITEIRRAESALKASEEKYRAIFNNAPVGIFRFSFGGGPLDGNLALARMLGFADVEEFRQNVSSMGSEFYVHAEDRERLLNALRERPEGTCIDVEFRRRDGSPIHTIVNAALHQAEDGAPAYIDGTIEDITERKLLELRLANQLAFQQALLDTIPYAVFYKGPDTRFVGFNRAYEECFGVRREDLIGKTVLELEYLPEKDRQEYQAEDTEVIANVGQVHRELPIFFSDGVEHLTLYSVTGFRLTDGSPGGLIGILVDITGRKQAEERLRQSEEKFSRIFEMAPECIYFVRVADNSLVDTNAAFETITGHLREEAIGRTLHELGLWSDLSVLDEFLQQLGSSGHVMNFELLLRRKDGELRRVVNSSQLVNLMGEECYISIIHDITDQRRMQELLIQSEKMMSVGSLAAGIAHEINNPLGIVHQAVQNLIQRTSPDQKKNMEAAASIGLDMELLQQYLKSRKLDVFLLDIQAAALRASGIIRNMLNFSRRSESKRNICDMHHVVEQSVSLASSDYDLKRSYDFKRIEIVLDLDENLPICSCTETEIEQVLLNLLRNAAQAMATAKPPTPNPRIVIRLRAAGSCVRIEVEDNGPGMASEVCHKVFEPFFTTKPPGVGTGLGLSVSYFIITKGHGGKMWVRSAPGGGTTFYIELPAEPQEALHA